MYYGLRVCCQINSLQWASEGWKGDFPPRNLKFSYQLFSKKRSFLSFDWVKSNFATIGPLQKYFLATPGKIHFGPPMEKILSTSMFITNLYRCDACGPGFSYTIIPLSIPVLAAASRRLSSSVSPVIRFLFLDLACKKCTYSPGLWSRR